MSRYSVAGAYQDNSFALATENSHAEGITTDGTSLWVVDKDADKVFRYDMGGDLQSSFSVEPATHPEGIAYDGASIWVVDKDTDTVYRFAVDGTPLPTPVLHQTIIVESWQLVSTAVLSGSATTTPTP